jgi:hypothetical protein
MVFFNEPGDAFSLPTLLQMCKGHEHKEDGYVYAYARNGNREGTMNQVGALSRPKGRDSQPLCLRVLRFARPRWVCALEQEHRRQGRAVHVPFRLGEHQDVSLGMDAERRLHRVARVLHDVQLGYGMLRRWSVVWQT